MSIYNHFHSLHQQDSLLLLPNAWDVMSAMIFEQAGFPAVGTTSYGMANAHGRNDGENISFDTLVESAQKIIEMVKVPVTVDIEAGFGADEDTIINNVLKIADIGAVGINIEDSLKKSTGLKEIDEQAALIKAIRKDLNDNGFEGFFINARIDTYLQQRGIEETIDRANKYAQHGANGVFVPGLQKADEIRTVVQEVGSPLNVMSLPNLTAVDELTKLGVKRLSMGNAFSDAVIGFIEETSQDVLREKSTEKLYGNHAIKTRFTG